MPSFGESLRNVGPYLNLGSVLAGCMVLGVLLGRWLDVKLGTEPWLLLAGSLLGMVSGFYHFFKVVLGFGKRSRDGQRPEK